MLTPPKLKSKLNQTSNTPKTCFNTRERLSQKIQLIPFEVFKKLVLTWARTNLQVLKKVITLCENIRFSFRELA
jgi:hypothetical protein